VKNWFQAFAIKCNLYRYTEVRPALHWRLFWEVQDFGGDTCSLYLECRHPNDDDDDDNDDDRAIVGGRDDNRPYSGGSGGKRTRPRTRRRWEVEACFSFALVQGDAAAAALRDARHARRSELLREQRQRQQRQQRQQQQSVPGSLYSSIKSSLGMGGGGGSGGEVYAMDSDEGSGGGGGDGSCHHGGGGGGGGGGGRTCGGGGGGGCAILEAIKSSPRHMARRRLTSADPPIAELKSALVTQLLNLKPSG
jgi:hypothetical protein